MCLLYGDPIVEARPQIWLELASHLQSLPLCLLIGDFNQLEWFEDKLGGAPTIRGWEVFMIGD